MITLNTTTDVVLQIHKNHVNQPIDETCSFVFVAGSKSKTVTITEATIQPLSNCYLVTLPVTPDLRKLGLNAKLSVMTSTNDVVFQSPIQLYQSEA